MRATVMVGECATAVTCHTRAPSLSELDSMQTNQPFLVPECIGNRRLLLTIGSVM